MTAEEIRQIENFVLSKPLALITHPENLQFLAALISDHDHLRGVLLTEPDRRKRRAKLEAMRPYLRFRADSCDNYELAEQARACGAQPIYGEQEAVSRIIMPPSFVHEVRG